MLKTIGVILICLVSLAAFCQSASKYQVGTITAVKPHQSANGSSSDAPSYEVSLKVADTVYNTLYTPPLGMKTVNYAAGRQILVLIGEKTITYNDIMGNSHEVPILSRKPATDAKQSK
jgi:hypothetical protein